MTEITIGSLTVLVSILASASNLTILVDIVAGASAGAGAGAGAADITTAVAVAVASDDSDDERHGSLRRSWNSRVSFLYPILWVPYPAAAP